MLIDRGGNRWEFNTIDDAVFVANELVAWLKNTMNIDVIKSVTINIGNPNVKTDAGTGAKIEAFTESLNNNE